MSRADRLDSVVRENGLDALLVTNLVNVRYLTGYTGTNGMCLVGEETRLFLTDFRYVTQAESEVDPAFDRVQGRQDLLEDAAKAFKPGRVGFEDFSLTVRQHERLRSFAPEGVELCLRRRSRELDRGHRRHLPTIAPAGGGFRRPFSRPNGGL